MSFFSKGYEGFILFISLFIFLFTPALARSEENRYLNELLKAASGKRLHSDRYWEILLHYKHTVFGTESPIDDPKFFLSPDGKVNPEGEIYATIKAFFDSSEGNEHPLCRFPARYMWLKDRLNIDEARLPDVTCTDLEDAVKKVNPKSAVLVFPTFYMNSPAFMFGHTLLRIDGAYQSELLSYAVNYAARTDGAIGFVNAFKGLFGHYKGYYSMLPYYEKVKEYNDMAQRDMWEYSLDLTEEEVKKMFLHFWELKDIYSDYYFFGGNCSYDLLFLLEAARPDLKLTERFGAWVLPVDTIGVVYEAGLVNGVRYRPSMAARIKHVSSLMEDEISGDAVLRLVNGEIRPEDVLSQTSARDEKIRILDLASEIIQYRYTDKKLDKEEYSRQFLSVLTARSSLGRPDESVSSMPEPPRPDTGHGSSRFGIGPGIKEDEVFSEIRFRPVYHDLLDPEDGYLEGSKVAFGEVAARYYHADGELTLESLDIIDIVSISPREGFLKPLSWKGYTGILNKTFSEDRDHLVYSLKSGVGLAFKSRAIGLYYLFLESDVNLGDRLDSGYSLGIGTSIGALKAVNRFWKVGLSAEGFAYGVGDSHKEYKVTFAQNFMISRNSSVTVDLSRSETFGVSEEEAKIVWNLYLLPLRKK